MTKIDSISLYNKSTPQPAFVSDSSGDFPILDIQWDAKNNKLSFLVEEENKDRLIFLGEGAQISQVSLNRELSLVEISYVASEPFAVLRRLKEHSSDPAMDSVLKYAEQAIPNSRIVEVSIKTSDPTYWIEKEPQAQR